MSLGENIGETWKEGSGNDPDEYYISSNYLVCFLVAGIFPNVFPWDMSFRSVSGITEEIETREIRAGGENEQTFRVPDQVTHANLVLKRGIVPLFWRSPLDMEFGMAMSLFKFFPSNVLIVLHPYKNTGSGWVKGGIDYSTDNPDAELSQASDPGTTITPNYTWQYTKKNPEKTATYGEVGGAWLFRNAYPVKWNVNDFGAAWNEYTGETYTNRRVVETLELAYSHFYRLV